VCVRDDVREEEEKGEEQQGEQGEQVEQHTEEQQQRHHYLKMVLFLTDKCIINRGEPKSFV
jgi:hypothetical protein